MPSPCAASDESRDLGFTVVIDMRNSTWEKIKPILKVLRDHFPGHVYTAYILKPDKFWQKQRTSIGSSKCKFEVRDRRGVRVSLHGPGPPYGAGCWRVCHGTGCH